MLSLLFLNQCFFFLFLPQITRSHSPPFFAVVGKSDLFKNFLKVVSILFNLPN